MATENDPRPVLRQELARIFKNQRVIRAFEKLFDLIPPEFIDQQVQIDTLNLVAELGAAQSTDAIAAVNRLAGVLESLELAPPVVDRVDEGDTPPVVEQADIIAATVEAKLTDITTNLIASKVALANGAAAGAGTIANAPAAGNPTKWVPIDDAGTIRYIPAW